MNSITFLLAVHNHQPIGNFGSVMETVYAEAYAPFLEVLERHPAVRIAAHHSGCLFDWLESAHPEYLDRLRHLVDRGQIELLGGAYYEPILPAIPEADRSGQIRKLARYVESRFGRTPAGAWIAERVWEPDLAGSLRRAGVEYTFLDDTHFLAGGADPEALDGPFLTEDRGHTLAVFPISKELRYLVPFRPPEDTVAFLRQAAERGPDRVFLLGDDGEKFGHWPDTHRLVYEEGWLDRFFELLEANDGWLRTGFPSEHVHRAPDHGRIYLPTAAYEEMGEWTLPAHSQGAYHAFREQVRVAAPDHLRFIRGGIWRAFLARYPESDRMSQRGLRLREESEALAVGNPDAFRKVQDHLWAAQCNCAYWHGVFGGIYLPHLRDAVWANLLEAEALLLEATRPQRPWVEGTRVDLDADGEPEVLLRNDRLSALLDPGQGGTLLELSLRRPALALGNGITRRLEAYHERLKEAGPTSAQKGTTASIHDRLEVKEPDLEQYLKIDSYPRVSLIDHAIEGSEARADFEAGRIPDTWGLRGPSRIALIDAQDAAVAVCRRLAGRSGVFELSVEKTVRLRPGTSGIEVAYRVEALGPPVTLGFGVEWNLALLDARSPGRRWTFLGDSEERSLDSRGETARASGMRFLDRDRGFQVELAWDRSARVWWVPVETVSLSESGLERVYQSTACLPWWPVDLESGGVFEVCITLAMDLIR